MLAIVVCLKEWRSYVEGAQHKVAIYTDHKNLAYFKTTKVLRRQQAQCSGLTGNLGFKSLYRKGSLQGKPVALTRRSDLMRGSKASEAAPQARFTNNQFWSTEDTTPANSLSVSIGDNLETQDSGILDRMKD